VSEVPGAHVSARWQQWRASIDLDEYQRRFERLEQSGVSAHGEADLIESFRPATVLDAGCGTGRVAVELHRRGIDVVGVDLDDDLLALARRADAGVTWVHADLAMVRLDRRFDVVAMPGNVMVFCDPADRGAIVANLAGMVADGGVLIAGFQIESGDDALTLAEYDAYCTAARLEPVGRWSTWQGDRYTGGDYAVSVHRRG
jgi:2-polyprenyl-3-methyl-5-hydroxy-6-metoxy-1,4-benzoquinol methylase